ncbi:hypothetical protein acdb102_23830 [Acidothermaceae bacterium B102]|nr:hypothetical protein acdb102_23830 [Acidothermaceae bacterium B102]
MGSWTVTKDRRPGVLWVEVTGSLSLEEAQAFLDANVAAIRALQGAPYVVFADSREMKVLSPEAASVFEAVKSFSSAQPNFRGSAILVSSAVVGMQGSRTSAAGGVADTELIASDEDVLWRHLSLLLAD